MYVLLTKRFGSILSIVGKSTGSSMLARAMILPFFPPESSKFIKISYDFLKHQEVLSWHTGERKTFKHCLIENDAQGPDVNLLGILDTLTVSHGLLK